jgi:hypothetical protein
LRSLGILRIRTVKLLQNGSKVEERGIVGKRGSRNKVGSWRSEVRQKDVREQVRGGGTDARRNEGVR